MYLNFLGKRFPGGYRKGNVAPHGQCSQARKELAFQSGISHESVKVIQAEDDPQVSAGALSGRSLQSSVSGHRMFYLQVAIRWRLLDAIGQQTINLHRSESGHRPPIQVDDDVSPGSPDDAGEVAKERRLSDARWADDRDALTFIQQTRGTPDFCASAIEAFTRIRICGWQRFILHPTSIIPYFEARL
jgi:hypothetical protein